MGRTASTEPQYLQSTTLYILPLMAVWIVQNLSACTVHRHLYYIIGWTDRTGIKCL